MNERSKTDSISVADALMHARQILTSHPGKAAEQARFIIEVEPGIAEAYLLLGTALRILGDVEKADDLEQQAIACALRDPVIVRASQQIAEEQYDQADRLLNQYLADTPNDPVAVQLRASIQRARGNNEEAERLLTRSVALAPGYQAAQTALDEVRSIRQAEAIEDEPWFTSQLPGNDDRSADDTPTR